MIFKIYTFIALILQCVYCTNCRLNGGSSTYLESIVSDTSARFGKKRRIQATGCPNHASSTQPNIPTDQNKDVSIPVYPCIADNSFNVKCVPDSLGIMLNGVSLFGQWADNTCGDAVALEGDTFDDCGGHATGSGNYHYHKAPTCLIQQLGDSTSSHNPTGHSKQIGWAYDGFPIYGPFKSDGSFINECNHPDADQSDCIDSCRGHSQHNIDGFTYHYHVTGPVTGLPDESMNPYTIGCLKGVPFSWAYIQSEGDTSCILNGTTDDYVPASKNGITSVYSTMSTSTASRSSYVLGIVLFVCFLFVL